jgi:hypothetical protein
MKTLGEYVNTLPWAARAREKAALASSSSDIPFTSLPLAREALIFMTSILRGESQQ